MSRGACNLYILSISLFTSLPLSLAPQFFPDPSSNLYTFFSVTSFPVSHYLSPPLSRHYWIFPSPKFESLFPISFSVTSFLPLLSPIHPLSPTLSTFSPLSPEFLQASSLDFYSSLSLSSVGPTLLFSPSIHPVLTILMTISHSLYSPCNVSTSGV